MASSNARTPLRRAFWPNLNVYLVTFALLVGFGSLFVMVPAGLLLKLVLPPRTAELVALPVTYAVFGLGLAWWWWRYGLAPARPEPGRERRLKAGHAVLAVGNVGVLSLFVPMLLPASWRLGFATSQAGTAMTLWAAAGPLLGALGLVMVWGARGRVEVKDSAFADTQVEGPSDTAPLPAQGLPRGMEAAILIAGALASSVLVAMGSVFAAIGMQGETDRFMRVVLPIIGGGFLLYLAITIWLAASGRRTAARWVAWSPVCLMFLLPAVQGLLFFVGSIWR